MVILRTVHVINNYIISSVSLICNCLMIYVIIKTSNSELQKYSRILLQSTVVDILLNLMNIFVCPIVITAHSVVIVSLNPIISVERRVERALFIFWVVTLYSSVCIIPIAFYFRYRVLCLNKKFTFKLHVTCLLIAGVVVTSYVIHVYYAFCSRTERNFYLAEVLAPWFGNENGKVNTIGITGAVGFLIKTCYCNLIFQFDPYFYVIFVHSSFNIILCYCIIVWCSYNIYKYLSRLEHIPHADQHILEVQKQIAKTLIVQAAIPIITFCVPANMILLTLLFEVKIPEYLSAEVGLMLTYIPFGNVLSIFFFVKAYKKFGIQLVRKAMKKISLRRNTISIQPHA